MTDDTENVNGSEVSNVVNLNEEKLKRKVGRPKKQGAIKLSPGEMEADLIEFLESFEQNANRPGIKFDHNFQSYRQHLYDDPCLLSIVNRTAHRVSKETIAAELSRFCKRLIDTPYFSVGLSTVEKAVKIWMHAIRDLKPLPASWGFSDEPEICFNRLDYVPDFSIKTLDQFAKVAPYVYEFNQRMTNSEPYLCQIGAMFFKEASRKQMSYLYGPTGCGKSQHGVLLNALLGTAAASFEADDFEGNFWKADLTDKRSIYIDECDPKFLQTSVFKALTGRRDKRINQKFERAFQGSIHAMISGSSNHPPAIPNDPAIKGRIIPHKCDIILVKKSEHVIHEAFKREAKYVAGYGMNRYRELYPDFGEIKCDQDELNECIDSFESEFIDLAEKLFVFGHQYYINSSSLNNTLAQNIFNKDMREEFKKFLVNRFGVVETRFERYFKKGNNSRIWGGLQLAKNPR